MKYLAVGDPHVTPGTLEQAGNLLSMVENYQRPTVWLGDLLDTKEVIRGKCQNIFFNYFKNSKLQHIVIVGNHDWFNLECEDHSLRTLTSLPNVIVVDKLLIDEGTQSAFLPYIHDQDKLKAELDKIPDNYTLFAHLEVKDFDFGNGRICEHGLTKEYFRRFKLVVSGHFHKYQFDSNFLYLGTPYSHSFGETDQEKYLATVDLPTAKLNLFKSPFPRHVTIKLDVDEPNHLETLTEFMNEHSGDTVRVQLFGSTENTTNLDRAAFGSFDVKFEDKSEGEAMANVSLDETLDNKTQFVQWATQIKNLDDETVQLGLSILEGLNAK